MVTECKTPAGTDRDRDESVSGADRQSRECRHVMRTGTDSMSVRCRHGTARENVGSVVNPQINHVGKIIRSVGILTCVPGSVIVRKINVILD